MLRIPIKPSAAGVPLLTPAALQVRCKVMGVDWVLAGPRSVSEGSLGAARCYYFFAQNT